MIEQALFLSDSSGPRLVAKSDGISFAIEETALKLVAQFGSRPAGDAKCPQALFALPFPGKLVIVVEVADLPGNDAPLGFQFRFLPKSLYENLGDPWFILETLPSDWTARGSLPRLEWPQLPLPPRTVQELHQILKSDDGPLLLGAVQALIDGARLVIKSPVPSLEIQHLWNLLPYRSRLEIWPATYVFKIGMPFQVQALPVLPEKLPLGHLNDEQVRDYPAGRYELALQSAVESLDQAELNRLLMRPSSSDALRLALRILALALGIALISKLF